MEKIIFTIWGYAECDEMKIFLEDTDVVGYKIDSDYSLGKFIFSVYYNEEDEVESLIKRLDDMSIEYLRDYED